MVSHFKKMPNVYLTNEKVSVKYVCKSLKCVSVCLIHSRFEWLNKRSSTIRFTEEVKLQLSHHSDQVILAWTYNQKASWYESQCFALIYSSGYAALHIRLSCWVMGNTLRDERWRKCCQLAYGHVGVMLCSILCFWTPLCSSVGC